MQNACGTYTWMDGNTYTSNNNTAKDTISNADGCDSVITLNLTINPIPAAPVINYSPLTFCGSDGVTLSTDVYVSYLWSDDDGWSSSSPSPVITDYSDPLILTVVDANGCTGGSLPFTSSITSLPYSPVSVLISDSLINVTNGGTASASSFYGSNYAADSAFDGNFLSGWESNSYSFPAWLEYDFGAGNVKEINAYTIYKSSLISYGYEPKSWIFEGWNGTVWDTLDVQTNETIIIDSINMFPIINTTAYQKYRINIIAGNSSQYVSISEMQLLQNIPQDCTNKTFAASTTGSDLTYQWYVNGIASGLDSAFFTSGTLSNNDSISCIVSSNYQCATNIPATSNSILAAVTTFDNTTTTNVNTITVNQAGAIYQWLDCNNANSPVSGAINQSYTALTNGSYAVMVTQGACSDTSACVNITSIGIQQLSTNNQQLSIYPNPNNGTVSLKSSIDGVYSLTNELGQTIQSVKLNNSNNYTMNIENLNNGVYFIIGFNNNQLTRQKVIVTK